MATEKDGDQTLVTALMVVRLPLASAHHHTFHHRSTPRHLIRLLTHSSINSNASLATRMFEQEGRHVLRYNCFVSVQDEEAHPVLTLVGKGGGERAGLPICANAESEVRVFC